MKKFKDQPLSRKALLLGVVPSVCAVLILALAAATGTYYRVLRNTQADLEGHATIVHDAVASALAAGDRAAATAALTSLQVRPNITSACLFDTSGALFVAHDRDSYRCPSTLDAAERMFSRPLLLTQTISANTGPIGSLVVLGNLNRFYAWIRILLGAILVALLGGMLVGSGLTYSLQRAVLGPILNLARVADAVTATRNYSLRARKITDDEVGGLVESFNSMLDELQRQNEALTVEVAERKRAEELKDAFLASVSHELRTPLNAILGRVQILRLTKPTDERLERALESLERNARSQARLVEDLLDVSRIVSGKFQLRIDAVDLRTVINRALEIAAPQAAARLVSLDVRLPAMPCLVSGDDDRLQQAVLNLISNAVKFGGGQAVTVELSSDDVAHTFAVSVADRGIGIAPEFLPNVFDRFRQADTSMTRQHGGLGLGLAIVKEVAELHQGSVTAVSAGLGRGATFTIVLPQLIEADSTVPYRESHVWAPRGPVLLGGVRVLVVDDEPDSLDVAATALTEAGASASRASSGQEAVRLWERDGFDALVCDLALPGMDGFQILDAIRAMDRRASRASIAVAVTAYASHEHRERCLAAGFQIHLAKPYNATDLVTALADALASRANAGEGRVGAAQHL